MEVITIIVLLILAGVSISMVVGENGVLNRATGAAKATTKAEAKQELSSWLVDEQSGFASDVWIKDTSLVFMTNYLGASGSLTTTKTFSSNGYTITIISSNATYDATSGHSGSAKGSIAKGEDTYYFELVGSGQMGAKIKDDKLLDTKPATTGWGS